MMMDKTRVMLFATILVILTASTFSTFTPPSVSALQTQDFILDPVSITIKLDFNGTAELTLSATCTNIGLSALTELSFRIESTDMRLLWGSVNDQPVDTEILFLERYSTVIVRPTDALAVNESVHVALRIAVNDIQTDVGASLLGDISYVDTIFYVRPLSTYRNFTLTTFLPSRGTLSQESVSPIFPSALSNFTDGQSLAFVWFTQEILPGQERVFIVRYQMKESSTIITGISDIQIFIVAIACLILGLTFGYLSPHIVDRIRKLGRVKFVGITSEEKEVLEVIRNKGGSCSQKDLYSDLSMSQSKVSLLLTALEERGLVRRFKDGRENTVHIIEQ